MSDSLEMTINADVEYTKAGFYSKKTIKAVCNAIQTEFKSKKKCDDLLINFNNDQMVVSFERKWKPVYKSYPYDLVVWFNNTDSQGYEYNTTVFCEIERGKIDWEFTEVENTKD